MMCGRSGMPQTRAPYNRPLCCIGMGHIGLLSPVLTMGLYRVYTASQRAPVMMFGQLEVTIQGVRRNPSFSTGTAPYGASFPVRAPDPGRPSYMASRFLEQVMYGQWAIWVHPPCTEL